MRLLLAFMMGLLIASCTQSLNHPVKLERPKTGYICKINEARPFGIVWVSIRIRDGERPNGFVNWHAKDDKYQNPRITGTWFMTEDQNFHIDNGYVDVIWRILNIEGKRRDSDDKLKLEFRVDDNERPYGNAQLSSPYQRSDGPFHIRVDWALLAALARGTDQLFLIARDKKNLEKLRIPIDSRIFDRAKPKVVEVMRRIETMIADPQANCDRHDFSEEDNVMLI